MRFFNKKIVFYKVIKMSAVTTDDKKVRIVKKKEPKTVKVKKTPEICLRKQIEDLKAEQKDFEMMLAQVKTELNKYPEKEAPEVHRLITENVRDFENSIKYCKDKIEANTKLVNDANLLNEHVKEKFVERFKK